MNPTTTMVEVFADITCPFTHVGLQRFAAGRDCFGPALEISHDASGFSIDFDSEGLDRFLDLVLA